MYWFWYSWFPYLKIPSEFLNFLEKFMYMVLICIRFNSFARLSNDLIFVSTDSSFYLSFKLVVLRGAVESFDFQFTALFDKVNGCPGKPEIYLLISWPFFYNLVLDSLVSSIVISKYSECKNYFNFIFLSPVNFLYDLRYFF